MKVQHCNNFRVHIFNGYKSIVCLQNQVKRNLSRIFKTCDVIFKISFLPGVRPTRRVDMPFLGAGRAPG